MTYVLRIAWTYFLKILIIFLVITNISCQNFDPNNDDTEFNDSELNFGAKIKQSNECTSEEIDNNIQCFQEIPKPLYEVPEGSSTTLRCIVRNQHGKVQWRAVPVLLGYDRNIPGRARYRVVGSVVKGEHFLEIRDVKVKDAGIYECQVQPVGQLHPLLRRKTRLVVLVQPTLPKIFYQSSKPINDQVIINSIKKDVLSVFICISHNGQPKVNFQWFLNNIPLKSGIMSVQLESLTDSKSKLSLLTNQLKDGYVIRCRVSNRATEVQQDPDKQHLESEVVIVVHKPPGQPKITDFTTSRDGSFIEGDIIKATCMSSPPGKPFGTILWKWKFPKIQDLFSNQLENYRIKDISSQYYQQSLSINHIVSKIELPPLTSFHHGAQLFCESSNSVISYQSETVKVLVKYAPNEVTISVNDGSIMTRTVGMEGVTETVVFGEAGEEKTLTCTTSSYYNEAMIKWQFYHSISMTEVTSQKIPLNPIEKVWKEEESYRRNSTIKIRIDKLLDKSFIDCQAWSIGKRVDARVKLDITYPSEKPIIMGYGSEKSVKVNQIFDLTCSTVGGNPLPELQWFRDNKPIDTTFKAEQIGNKKSLKIKISPTIADNNVKYFCQARTIGLKTSPENSDEITLTVLFPPLTIDLKSLSGIDVTSGNILTLQCIAGESNPPAIVKWKISRCGQMMAELGRRPVQTNCNDETLSTSSQKMISGKYGGSIIKSNVDIRTDWRDHLDYVDCEIYNAEYGEEYHVLRKRIQINVTFTPKFDGIHNKHFSIEEGHAQTFNLEPIANPPVKRYNWYMGSYVLEPNSKTKSVYTEKAKLTVTNANPMDMGNYTLVAVNEKGESRITIYLNITYRAIIIGDKFEIVTNNRQNADLECSVKANPANPELSFKWVKLIPSKGFNDISNSDLIPAFTLGCNQAEWKGAPDKSNFKYFSKCNVKSQFEMTNLLIVYDIDRNDVGLYKCIVNNGIGEDVIKTVELNKDFTPQILVVPKFSKSSGNTGDNVSLFCHIRAEPKPDVSWYYGRFNNTIIANYKYRLNMTRYRPGFYVAHLLILNFQSLDYGDYFCKAENVKGSDSRKIEVLRSTVPDVPLELQVINKSGNSIEISWVQGFDGGSLQTFQVRWREKSPNSLYKYDDVASDDSKIILSFVITGLKSDTTYDVSINSRNPQHGKSEFTKPLIISTSNFHSEFDSSQVNYPVFSNIKLQDNTILFIVATSVFGFVILVVNILVIIFVLRRRHQRSRMAKLEARYSDPKSLLAASNGLILSRDDSMKEATFNYLRSDMVELYPRSLDSSHILQNNSQHFNSLRRSIPDDQKTFSSFETGSDDVREDLLRKQKEFGCCSIGQNSQKRPIMIAYDPITKSSYYAPVCTANQTTMYIPPGMYDQDKIGTLIPPVYKGDQRQMMNFINMIPMNGQMNLSLCDSINNGQIYCNNPQMIIGNNISPTGSTIVSSISSLNNISPSKQNIVSYPLNNTVVHNSNNVVHVDSLNSNDANSTPYRSNIINLPPMTCNIGPQNREVYTNELRKAQLSGNIITNPDMFSCQLSPKTHHLTGSPPLISPHIVNSLGSSMSMPIASENMSTKSGNAENFADNMRNNNDSHLNPIYVPNNFESSSSQKYRCVDNEIINNANSQPLKDSIHQNNSSDSQHLPPRPNMIQ